MTGREKTLDCGGGGGGDGSGGGVGVGGGSGVITNSGRWSRGLTGVVRSERNVRAALFI